jgi:hypothetical protein
MRAFRIAGRPGFRDKELPALRCLTQVRGRADGEAKKAIDDALDEVVAEAIADVLGDGNEAVAIRLHLGYAEVSGARSPVRHKARAEAAASAVGYSLDWNGRASANSLI